MNAEFGCGDGSCPFSSRHGMHTNGGCRCTYAAFPDPEQRRTVDVMLAKARAVATRDAEIAMQRKADERERRDAIGELRKQLGRETDREVIEGRRRLRAEIARLEQEL